LKAIPGLTATSATPPRLLVYLFSVVTIGCSYFALAKLGLALASVNPSATPIWPPTGLALAAVLLFGYRIWPAIFLGALIANITTAGSLFTSLAIAGGNSLEAIVGALLVNLWTGGGRRTFELPLNVARFALIALPATSISATIGVLALAAAGFAPWSNFAVIWMTWWLGDLAGALVVTPVLTLWWPGNSDSKPLSGMTESALVFLLTIAVGLVAFSPLLEQTANRSSLGFLAVLPLLWAALRCGQRDTATVALLLAFFAVWGTLANGGPFARTTLNDSFLLLLMFMISTTVPSLVLSAEVATRMRTTERLQKSQIDHDHIKDQLAQAQKMEALGQLTGGVAHDFNNLLMIVNGQTELLRKRLTDPMDLKALDAIKKTTARGASLTRQLLGFSRRQGLNPVVIALRERLEDMREMLARSLRGDIELDIDIPADIWNIEADPAEFELALVNVAVNARDAMPSGGKLRMTFRNVVLGDGALGLELSGNFVAVEMADTGEGIASEVMPRIFEPFFSTKKIGKGTGLGLSQVYGFARQSGGAVRVNSFPSKGTSVTIYLPRSLAASPVTVETTAPSMDRGEGTILVVDDNADVNETTSSLLERAGYDVLRADNADEALEILGSGKKVDLLFSDIVMPGDLSGVDLARRVRTDYPRIHILLTSGYHRERDAQNEFEILLKPFEPVELERAVHDMLADAKSRPENKL